MLQLLNPFMLFALLGLVIPIAIHVWNQKSGKRIKIGSVALLQESQSKRMHSIQLSELLLLLLRCLLLALLTILISQPQWITKQNSATAGWILISPELVTLLQTDKNLSQTLDSLQQKGFELHLFTKEFPRLRLDEKNVVADTAKIENYWSLLREAELKLASGAKVFLFTGESLQAVQGKRPTLNLDLQWITLPAPDTTQIWLADAFLDKRDSLHITFGLSKPDGNIYQTVVYKKPIKEETLSRSGIPNFIITPINGKFSLQLAGTNQNIEVDTAALAITIFFEEATKEDARYVESALKAITAYTQRNINIRITTALNQIPQYTNWLFWLSAQPLSTSWAEKIKAGTNVLKYTSVEKFKTIDTWLTLPFAAEKYIDLYRLSTNQPAGISLWKDAFGHPVLTQLNSDKGLVYQFYSRFHPLWNELVWHEQFAHTIMNILQESLWNRQIQSSKPYDQRLISAQQLIPKLTNSKEKQEDIHQVFSLYEPLWILIIILFLLERWLSGRSIKENERKKTKSVQKEMAS